MNEKLEADIDPNFLSFTRLLQQSFSQMAVPPGTSDQIKNPPTGEFPNAEGVLSFLSNLNFNFQFPGAGDLTDFFNQQAAAAQANQPGPSNR